MKVSDAPNTMKLAAASAAPPETPIRVGSASGLRNRPCIAVPPTAEHRADAQRHQAARNAEIENDIPQHRIDQAAGEGGEDLRER